MCGGVFLKNSYNQSNKHTDRMVWWKDKNGYETHRIRQQSKYYAIFGNFSVTYFVFSITIAERLLSFLFGITTAGSKQNLFCVSDKQCIIKELWTVDFQLWLKFRSARWTDSDIINKLSMTNKGPFSARYSLKISSKPDDLN